MKNKRGGINKKGISLIVLIITIIVIIILAGAIILNLTNNNPIDNARKAKFLNDVDTFKSDLSLYELNKMGSTEGNYNPKALNADKNSVSENGVVDIQRTIIDVISSMKDTKYEEKLEVIAGELVYVGDSEKESNWLDGVIESKNFKMNIVTVPDMNKISGKVTLSGFLVDETKIEYYRIYISKTGGTYPDTPSVEITDKKKEVEFEINNLVANTEYYIKVELKMSNEPDVRVLESGKIITKPDSVVPNTPQITAPGYSNNYTITPITVTLTDDEGGSGISKTNSKYIIDKTATSYNEEDSMWQSATGFLGEEFTGNTATVGVSVVEEGEYYVHVLAVDNARNKKSGISGKIVVDTLIPNEAGITIPTTTTTNSIDATVVLNDNENGSGIDLSKCKYIYSTVSYPYGDTESIWDTGTVFTSETQTITVTSSTNEIYYLHVLLVDKAGNRREVLSSGVTTNIETPVAPLITGTIATNTWTNQNVTLTVNEVTSPGITRYEYSVNGGAWQTYNATNKVVVISEGTSTVKARAINNVGTIGAESTGYIVKIDKAAPSTPTVNFNGYTPNTWTSSNVVLDLSSTDATSGISKYQYSVDNGTTWTDISGNFIINWDFWGNTIFRSVDNTGNASSTTTAYVIARETVVATYTSVEVKNVTSTGYDVYVYGVADSSSGVNRVQFPTWTEYNGQDDLLSSWQTNPQVTGQNQGNGTWYYRVNISSHNNESGKYITHIYIWDNAGNVRSTTEVTAQIVTKSYGTSIQDTYSAIYISNNPQVAFTTKNHNYDTYYNGNFYLTQSLMNVLLGMGGQDIVSGRTTYDGWLGAYVYAGENTFNLTRNSNLNRWMYMFIFPGGMTTGVYIGNIRFKFADGSILTPEQAVTNGYIEPLVIMGSGAYSTAYNGLWTNFMGLKNGGTTSTQNYPMGTLIFKIKDRSPLSNILMYSSKAFNTTYDGVRVFECNATTDLSITPF